MEYNARFVPAVELMRQNDGEYEAGKLFDALFNKPKGPAINLTPDQLHTAMVGKAGFCPRMDDIRRINCRIGTPYEGWANAVPWIKEARIEFGCGLKEAKEIHDFVRDNPNVLNFG